MQKKDLDWEHLGFGYTPTDFRFQARWKDGAWTEDGLVSDPEIKLSEAACVFHYAQCCFEGLKAYTTKNGDIVILPSRTECRPYGSVHKTFGNAGFPGRSFRQSS